MGDQIVQNMSALRTAIFSAYACLHYYLAIYQFDYMESIPAERLITYPILLTALGGIWDNMKLACGAYWGKGALSPAVAHVSFFLHMAMLPSLLASFAHMVGLLLDIWWVKHIGNLGSLVFCFKGIKVYSEGLHGKLVTTEEGGVARLSVPSHFKRNQDLLLPVILISLGSIVLGSVVLWSQGDPTIFILNVAGFFAHSLVSTFRKYGPFISNGLEVIFVYSIMIAQNYIIAS